MWGKACPLFSLQAHNLDRIFSFPIWPTTFSAPVPGPLNSEIVGPELRGSRALIGHQRRVACSHLLTSPPSSVLLSTSKATAQSCSKLPFKVLNFTLLQINTLNFPLMIGSKDAFKMARGWALKSRLHIPWTAPVSPPDLSAFTHLWNSWAWRGVCSQAPLSVLYDWNSHLLKFTIIINSLDNFPNWKKLF